MNNVGNNVNPDSAFLLVKHVQPSETVKLTAYILSICVKTRWTGSNDNNYTLLPFRLVYELKSAFCKKHLIEKIHTLFIDALNFSNCLVILFVGLTRPCRTNVKRGLHLNIGFFDTFMFQSKWFNSQIGNDWV